jgi:hypothetical protein
MKIAFKMVFTVVIVLFGFIAFNQVLRALQSPITWIFILCYWIMLGFGFKVSLRKWEWYLFGAPVIGACGWITLFYIQTTFTFASPILLTILMIAIYRLLKKKPSKKLSKSKSKTKTA